MKLRLASIGWPALVVAAACGGSDVPPPPTRPAPTAVAVAVPVVSGAPRTSATAAPPTAPAPDPDPGPLGVVRGDPQRGDPLAPVTVVEVIAVREPGARALSVAMTKLEQQLGPRKVRRVLRVHAPGRDDSIVARAELAVLKVHGASALFALHEALAVIKEGPLHEERVLRTAIDRPGPELDELKRVSSSPEIAADLDERVAWARKLGVAGPTLFVNGFECSRRTGFTGNDPKRLAARLEMVIEEELSRARSAMIDGVPAHQISARRSEDNLAVPRPLPEALADDMEIAMRVPVEGSPARGPATAPVTIVQFSEFQCPFCSVVQQTLLDLEKKYPGKLRMVWKNNPLPFHPRAEPVAELAMEAFAQRGDAAFWRVHDRIWKQQHRLADLDLLGIGAASGVNAAKVKDAIAKKKHRVLIQRDVELARRLRVAGVPQFFVNGRRLAGAQPFTAFAQIIDEEIAVAEQLVASGVKPADVYTEVMKRAFEPPPLPPAPPPPPPGAPRPPTPRFHDPIDLEDE